MGDISTKDALLSRLPLFLVFLSGIGFSIQTLIVKLLAVNLKYYGSFECVCARGFVQLIISAIFIYYNTYTYNKQVREYEETNNKSLIELLEKPPQLFGNTNYVRLMIFLRSVIGYGGISLTFLATEYIPISDSIVLSMLSPLVASVNSFLFLGENISIYEGISIIASLIGTVFVAKPSFLFPNHSYDNISSSDHTKGVVAALFSSLFAGYAYMFVRILGTSAKMPWSNVCFSQAIGQIVLSLPFIYLNLRKEEDSSSSIQLDSSIPIDSSNSTDTPSRLFSLFDVSTSPDLVEDEDLDYFMRHRDFLIPFLIFLAGFVGAWSQISMTIGMQREKSAAATAMRMSDIVMGFIWQFIFTSDKISMLSVLGAFIIVFSILIIVIFKDTGSTASDSVTSSSLENDKKKSSSNYQYNVIEMNNIEIEDDDESNEFQFLNNLNHKVIYSSEDEDDYHYLDNNLDDDDFDLENNNNKRRNFSNTIEKNYSNKKNLQNYNKNNIFNKLHNNIDSDDELSN